MINNIGENKEFLLVKYVNNKSFEQLNDNFKKIVKNLFPSVQKNDVLYAGMVDEYIKPDFYIQFGTEKKYISLKTGVNTTVHQEYIYDFCKYLIARGISKATIKTILLYHYGDGTLDGTGDERWSYATMRKNLEEAFPKANEELNSNRQLVVDLIERFVFKGRNPENIEADYVYHGEIESGYLVSKNQVLRHAEIKTYDFYETLHIGPILFRPHARYYKKAIRKEKYRQKADFYWPNIISDFIYMQRYIL